MARGKRRAPIRPEVILPGSTLNDEVDDFIDQRHNLDADQESDPDAQLNEDISSEDQISSDEDESDDMDHDRELAEKRGWGGKKSLYYGGDTHEYEIMEEEERQEALKDEEEEALRLQKEAVAKLHPDDYRDEDEDDTDVNDDSESEKEGANATINANGIISASSIDHAAPEIPVLIQEMLESRRQAMIWKDRIHWNEIATILFHLYASLVSNIAFYLSLRTDPDSEGVDIRTHPVLVQIVRIRSLLKDARALPCEKPATTKPTAQAQIVDVAGEQSGTTGTSHANGLPGTQAQVNVAVPNGVVKPLDKNKKRKKRRNVADLVVEEDEERIRALLPSRVGVGREQESGDNNMRDEKRRKLGALVGAMERERQNTASQRLVSGDVDVVRAEPKAKKLMTPISTFEDPDDPDMDSIRDDDGVMAKMLANKAKKEARKSRKAAESKPHVYTFKDKMDPEARRRASSQVVKNRGLTRYRPKDKKTPRTKNRLAYSKAVVRRKGAVQDYDGKPGSSYSGEASGINMSARKGSRLSNV
ncbi:unnamed protein product [Chondrus crispus]|uniref:Sas10 C-terminal domain-containing protein n=1 Tax=Chondrus crispus TaxID=2769 RepID=R7QHP5_CHOCR|nr:unnamed protein product [Chondrus crispus]CDF36945.1 unnamed protein product [Chondrus crispus]|eukprot:XP_005716764.1 unnamed protein product [Chondrus crispus]